ncbi:hypothetical protein FB451DRAFT_1281028 [Mycena latifolia]|nr:hypothetical protein FB451DRAFT_1281028 [Mycena latifolia]
MDQNLSYPRVDHLWFPEGTLVIRAENMIFRVLKSVMAARSPVFRDMVDLPQPKSRISDTIDDIPAVTLPDSATDVEAFLKAIFDSSYSMSIPDCVEIADLLGILRLSHKYDVQYLHRWALRHLGSPYYFTSLNDFWKYRGGYSISYDPDQDYGPTLCDYLAIIAAARQVDALWLLPIAYYLACQDDEFFMVTIPHETEYDLCKCVEASSILSQEYLVINGRLANALHPACATPQACGAARLEALASYFTRLAEGARNPLWSWSYCDPHGYGAMCDPCLTVFKTFRATNLHYLWTRLPAIFELPSWEELDVLKRAALGEMPLRRR